MINSITPASSSRKFFAFITWCSLIQSFLLPPPKTLFAVVTWWSLGVLLCHTVIQDGVYIWYVPHRPFFLRVAKLSNLRCECKLFLCPVVLVSQNSLQMRILAEFKLGEIRDRKTMLIVP